MPHRFDPGNGVPVTCMVCRLLVMRPSIGATVQIERWSRYAFGEHLAKVEIFICIRCEAQWLADLVRFWEPLYREGGLSVPREDRRP